MISDCGYPRKRRRSAKRLSIGGVLSVVIVLAHGLGQAAPPPHVDPRPFFNIPPGPLHLGDGERLLVRDGQAEPVVARLYATIGQYSILLLPDGSLAHRRNHEIQRTDEPFVPVSADAFATILQSRIQQRLGPAGDKSPGFRLLKTRHYVFVYDTSDAFAQTASRVMNSMIRGVIRYARNQRIAVQEPEVPLAVIMFRTRRDYQRYRRMPPGLVAYYETLSNHVVMFEESELAAVRPDLARQQSISTMAHEGAHQILHNIGVQRRLSNWPMWLAEGLAEYFAPTSTGARLRWKGAGEINDFRMSQLEEYLKSKATDALDGSTLRQTIAAPRLSSTDYATAWSLTHYLATKHRADFNRFVHATSQLGPFEGDAANNLVQFQQFFSDDLASLEQQVLLHLQKQPYSPPYARFPHHVVTIAYPTADGIKRVANLFLIKEQAEQWRRQTLRALNQEQRKAAKSRTHVLPSRESATRFRHTWLSRS